jgi:hypothetical protein
MRRSESSFCGRRPTPCWRRRAFPLSSPRLPLHRPSLRLLCLPPASSPRGMQPVVHTADGSVAGAYECVLRISKISSRWLRKPSRLSSDTGGCCHRPASLSTRLSLTLIPSRSHAVDLVFFLPWILFWLSGAWRIYITCRVSRLCLLLHHYIITPPDQLTSPIAPVASVRIKSDSYLLCGSISMVVRDFCMSPLVCVNLYTRLY